MAISARNQLEGKVVQVILGDVMAHVDVRIGKGQIESVITRRSAEKLGLKKGDKVTVIIKSTEVMLEKEKD
jgi:molybdopterin-binding protein